MSQVSILEKHRKQYQPKVPLSLRQGIAKVKVVEGAAAEPAKDREAIKKSFPNTYGKPLISFQSGATPANPNPSASAWCSPAARPRAATTSSPACSTASRPSIPRARSIGFLGGPGGLEKGKYETITPEKMDAYRNTGGFDIIGSGRTKLETPEQFDRCIEVIKSLELNAIVIIGGDDSNTNAAILAEYLKAKGLSTSVIGVPKTIDGDLKNTHIPVSFGFDTAVKTYSELIGNIARDAGSAKKYWHFIKLMGRSASHIALEAGLQTRANVTLVSEEVEKRNLSLEQIVDDIARVISARADAGKNYGVVLIPEGLIEFIPSFKILIGNLNDLLAKKEADFSKLDTADAKIAAMSGWLAGDLGKTFASLPTAIQLQLLLDRDPHGNVQVSLIDTDALLAEMVGRKLKSTAVLQGQVLVPAPLLRVRGPGRRPFQLRRRLLLQPGLRGGHPGPQRPHRLHGFHPQRVQGRGPVVRRRHSHHHDVQHGTAPWPFEARHPEGPGGTGRPRLQGPGRQPRQVGSRRRLHLSRTHPILRPFRSLRCHHQDPGVGTRLKNSSGVPTRGAGPSVIEILSQNSRDHARA